MTAHITHYSRERGEYQTEYTPPEILTEWMLYNRKESGKLHLFAIGGKESDGFSDNWDIYASECGHLYSIARPESGAEGTHFGSCRHVKNLMRCGYWHDTLTPYGEEMMKGA